jgi:hypothetical protein
MRLSNLAPGKQTFIPLGKGTNMKALLHRIGTALTSPRFLNTVKCVFCGKYSGLIPLPFAAQVVQQIVCALLTPGSSVLRTVVAIALLFVLSV